MSRIVLAALSLALGAGPQTTGSAVVYTQPASGMSPTGKTDPLKTDGNGHVATSSAQPPMMEGDQTIHVGVSNVLTDAGTGIRADAGMALALAMVSPKQQYKIHVHCSNPGEQCGCYKYGEGGLKSDCSNGVALWQGADWISFLPAPSGDAGVFGDGGVLVPIGFLALASAGMDVTLVPETPVQ